jgi:hypothetical protein
MAGLFDFKEKVFLSDSRGINIQYKDAEIPFREMSHNLGAAFQSGYGVPFPLQTLPKIAPARQIMIDDANPATHYLFPSKK